MQRYVNSETFSVNQAANVGQISEHFTNGPSISPPSECLEPLIPLKLLLNNFDIINFLPVDLITHRIEALCGMLKDLPTNDFRVQSSAIRFNELNM